MKHYFTIDQDHMKSSDIRKLKMHTLPYLDKNYVRLDMSDRSIVQRELDLTTDSVLPDKNKSVVVDLFYSMRECLSTHDNLSRL